MGAFRYVAYRRWYAYVCGCVGAASNVGAGASVNIAPWRAGAPGFVCSVPKNFRYFRFLGGWGWGMPKKIRRLGLRESPWECVRERGFEWEREGRDTRQKGGGAKGWVRKRQSAKKRGATPPAGNTSPVQPAQPEKPAGERRPAFSSITSVGFIRLRSHRHRRNHRCTNRPAADPANPPTKNPPQTRHPTRP